MSINKILFLDMDGVLNSAPPYEVRLKWNFDKELYLRKLYGIDPDLANNLKKIIDQTQCKIVFSTSWRYYKDHPVEGSDWRKNLAHVLNVSQEIFIGNTPDLSWQGSLYDRCRGLEIKEWLQTNTEFAIPGNYKYCVIDDVVDDIVNVIDPNHVVHTDETYGLQQCDVDKAIKILND